MKGHKITKKIKYCSKIRYEHLKNIKKNIFESKILDLKTLFIHEDANVMWGKVASDIKNVAKDMIDLSKGKYPNNKNNWW